MSGCAVPRSSVDGRNEHKTHRRLESLFQIVQIRNQVDGSVLISNVSKGPQEPEPGGRGGGMNNTCGFSFQHEFSKMERAYHMPSCHNDGRLPKTEQTSATTIHGHEQHRTQKTMDFLHCAHWIQAQQHQEVGLPFQPKQHVCAPM